MPLRKSTWKKIKAERMAAYWRQAMKTLMEQAAAAPGGFRGPLTTYRRTR